MGCPQPPQLFFLLYFRHHTHTICYLFHFYTEQCSVRRTPLQNVGSHRINHRPRFDYLKHFDKSNFDTGYVILD